MDEEIFIGFFGLILTQLRYARRALEDVERSTARYTGGGFAAALQAGPRFAAPPILDGALKVHIVNINDLAAGQNGLGALFGNLVSGVGGLVGGIAGGFVGGLVGGAALPYNLTQLKEIVKGLPPVLELVKQLTDKPKDKDKKEAPTDYAALTGLLHALTQMMPPLTNLVNALGKNLPLLVDPITALFRLFTQPGKAEPTAKQPATPSPPIDWVRFAEALTPLVKGLTLLVPILVGAFASLVVHLDALQRTITDLLIWALRLVFLLRGAVLVVIYDTLATVARIAAETLTVLSTAVLQIMSAVFMAIERGLVLAMDLLAMLSKGVSDTLNAVVNWLRTTLFDTLTMLGNLPIFAAIINAVNASSALISRVSGTPLPPPVAMPSGTGGGISTKGTALDLSQTLTPADKVAALGAEYSATAQKTFGDIKGAVDKLKDALGEIEKRNAALEAGVGKSGAGSPLSKALENVKTQSDGLGEALKKARGPDTPAEMPAVLKNIADAYQSWLANGAMNGLLDQITTYFHATPTSGPDAGKTVPGRIVVDAQSAGPLRPTVQIDEMVIELGQPDVPAPAGAPESQHSKSSMTLDQFGELWDDLVTDRHHRRLRLIPGII